MPKKKRVNAEQERDDETRGEDVDGTAEGQERALVPIVADPVRDGSAVMAHDGYDVQQWLQALHSFPRLRSTIEDAGKRLVTAPALFQDLFLSLFKPVPLLSPPVPLTPAYMVNQEILEQVLSTVEWRELRACETVGDLLNAAMATMLVARKALEALDTATVERINHLHELESGATTLFEEAMALVSQAEQQQGDGGETLFAQAEQARSEAKLQRAEAEAEALQLAAEAEPREATIRRAARGGLRQAQEQVDSINAAERAFAGGYDAQASSDGHAQHRLAPKEKLNLALKVGKSARLQQLAAICGRYIRIALKVQESKVDHPPREIASIALGSDLSQVLPGEFIWLEDPDLEDVFYYKFAMGLLMQVTLVGYEPQGQGPIIVALDNSGSMNRSIGGGMTREVWSKAVTMALLAIARLQQRDIVIIHFAAHGQLSTQQFLKGQGNHTEVIGCMDHFFDGPDTVFEPWMQEALRLVDEARFDRADVIVISDGLTSISAQVEADWQERRAARGMRAYGVLIETPRSAAGQPTQPSVGEQALARIVDALLPLGSLQEENAVLQQILAV